MLDRFHHLFIAAEDFDRSLAFYRDVLGWTMTDSWGKPGADRGAILSGGGVKVVIAQRPASSDADGRPTLHLDIHDLEARFGALPPGDHVVAPPEATHWGTRWFVVRDPDGNLIAFEQAHERGR